MMNKPFEDNKVFVLVSDIMAWSACERKIKKPEVPPPPEDGIEQEPKKEVDDSEPKDSNDGDAEEEKSEQPKE